MIVELELNEDNDTVRLVEPDDFKGFKVVLHGDAEPTAERVAPLGIVELDEHAWVSIPALRALAGAAATPEWESSLAGMIGYARSKGWVDDELDAIRAHIEHAPPA